MKNKLRTLKAYVPLVNITPIFSFPKRLVKKWKWMVRWFLFPKFRFSGARKIENMRNTNSHLILNRTQALGEKNFIIEVPKDKVIFEHVKRLGCWEVEVCLFLSQGLKEIANREKKIGTLIDLGANSGLISLQTARMLKSGALLVLVEPIPIHVEAINFNLSTLAETFDVTIFPIALGKNNEKMHIYSDVKNFGNTSLSINAMPNHDFLSQIVDVEDARDWAVANLDESEFFVIKCDLQGHDAMVLSRIPERIWDKTECAVVEIWASTEIEAADVDKCLSIWSGYQRLSWDAEGQISSTLEEIRIFWLSQVNAQRNLFISR